MANTARLKTASATPTEQVRDRGSIPTRAGQTDAGCEPSDEDLLQAFATGDSQAARLLTARLGPRAFGVALRVLGNRADAEEVTQDAMLRLWRAAPDWQAGAAKPGTWLYKVVVNLCIDRQRRARGGMLDLDAVPEPVDQTLSAPEQMMQADRRDALQAALMQLPERQRQAVVLRHIEGLSNPEIAEIMDIGVEAVESLTARGKRALSRSLADRRSDLGYA